MHQYPRSDALHLPETLPTTPQNCTKTPPKLLKVSHKLPQPKLFTLGSDSPCKSQVVSTNHRMRSTLAAEEHSKLQPSQLQMCSPGAQMRGRLTIQAFASGKGGASPPPPPPPLPAPSLSRRERGKNRKISGSTRAMRRREPRDALRAREVDIVGRMDTRRGPWLQSG